MGNRITKWKPQHAIYWHRVFSHSALLKSISSTLTWVEHCKENEKPGYFHHIYKNIFPKDFCKNLLWKATCSESHDTPYTGTWSFSHSSLVKLKATSTTLTWIGHCKESKKPIFIRIFCNNILAKTSYGKPHHAVKATTRHILAQGRSLIPRLWKPQAAL